MAWIGPCRFDRQMNTAQARCAKGAPELSYYSMVTDRISGLEVRDTSHVE